MTEAVTGSPADLAVILSGPDLKLLRHFGQQTLDVLQQVNGSADASFEQEAEQAQLRIGIDRKQVARFGINVRDIQDVVELASRYTLARMLARDDFAKRYKDGRAIGLHELMYPLLQAYDSVAVRSDLELGGTDQTFNLLVGRDIQEAFGQQPQDILTTPLLEGLDGVQKMSKSLDNYIGIDEPPDVMYRKAMGIPDNLIVRYFSLVTDASPAEVAAEESALRSGENPRDVKRRLAERLVRQFHPGADVAAYRNAGGGFLNTAPSEKRVAQGERSIADLFVEAGLAASKSEARRLAAQGGLTVDGTVVKSADDRIAPKDGMVLQRGAHRVVRLRLS